MYQNVLNMSREILKLRKKESFLNFGYAEVGWKRVMIRISHTERVSENEGFKGRERNGLRFAWRRLILRLFIRLAFIQLG